jgi:hypothetical protein
VPGRGSAGRQASRDAFAIAVVAVLVYLVGIVARLPIADGDPATFVRFGSRSATYPLATQVFGDRLYAPTWQGHDGQAFWVMARDPLLLDPANARTYIQAPGTRAGRILYPVLVAPWRIGGESALLWGMLLTNLVALGAGTYVTARFAQRLGGTATGGLAFAANPAVYFGVLLDLSDVLLVALLVGFVYLVHRKRFGPAIAVAIAAGLAKESALAIVLSVAVLAPGLPRRFRIAAPTASIGVYGLWMLYQRSRIGTDVDNVRAFSVVPLKGWWDAMTKAWLVTEDYWMVAIAGVVMFVLAGYIIVRFFRRRTLLMAAALPMAVAGIFYAGEVVKQPEDLSRSLGASITFLALDVIAERSRARTRPRAGPAAVAS